MPAAAYREDSFSFFLRGSALSEAFALDHARRCLARTLAVPEGAAEVLAPEGVEACYRLALERDPDCLEACVKLGERLLDQEDFEPARRLFQRALQRDPHCAPAWQKLGTLNLWTGREAQAEAHLRRALALDPQNLRARFLLGQLLLGQGRYEEGWPARETRPARLVYGGRVAAPEWPGGSPAGKAILIGQEGGLGDMIQFARYVPVLKDQGAARIGIVCQPALTQLFATLPGLDLATPVGEPLPDEAWDGWVLPMSLPSRCGTTLATIPAALPYLRPEPALVDAWASRLPAGGPRVGLAWRGNPHLENDAWRSLPGLGTLAGLARVPGIQFVSLQIGPGAEEASHPPAGMALFEARAWIGDLVDTAALLAHLDLVISVDTAVAHLAGALGRPCWVLLPAHKTDWRWLKERDDSPWYPSTTRLFRQGPGEGWGPVVERVAQALGRFQSDQRQSSQMRRLW